MTKIFHKVQQWQLWRAQKMSADTTIGFVPTMGNLHDGHKSLVKRSIAENDQTVVSIFVNPTQFNHQQDFKKYPKTLEQDIAMLENCGVDYLLLGDYDSFYPDNYRYRVEETEISQIMEGQSRSGHFDGVLTIVLKLFILTQPKRAYFGEKDYQQLKLIQGMSKAFLLDIEIIACPTIYHPRGLPYSSRNNRLSQQQFEKAQLFPQLLRCGQSTQNIQQQLENKGFKVDYIEDHWGRRFGAVYIDDVRLIDNVILPD